MKQPVVLCQTDAGLQNHPDRYVGRCFKQRLTSILYADILQQLLLHQILVHVTSACELVIVRFLPIVDSKLI